MLNEARKKIHFGEDLGDGGKLQERGRAASGGNMAALPDDLDKLFERALKSLSVNGVLMDREKWIKFGEEAEQSGFGYTCRAIINSTITMGLEKTLEQDPKQAKHTWIQDAQALSAELYYGARGTAATGSKNQEGRGGGTRNSK